MAANVPLPSGSVGWRHSRRAGQRRRGQCAGLAQPPCTGCSNPATLSSEHSRAGPACHDPSRVRPGHTAAGRARVLKIQDAHSPIAGHDIPAVVVTMAEVAWYRHQQSAERLESRIEVVVCRRGERLLPQSFYRMFPKELQFAQQFGDVKGSLNGGQGRRVACRGCASSPVH